MAVARVGQRAWEIYTNFATTALGKSPKLKMSQKVEQVGAELCQAQVKLEVVDEVVAEDGCRGCSWSKPHAVWFKVTTCPDGSVDGG